MANAFAMLSGNQHHASTRGNVMENKWTIGNIVYMVNALVLVLAFLMMGIKAASAQDQRAEDLLQQGTYSAQDSSRLTTADPVDQQLAGYARRIPEMGFLRVYGEKGAQFTKRLPGMLGTGAKNMDYAHEENQRQDIVNLQLYRIAKMAEQGMPSATLFKLGKDSAFDHRYLCVVTLDTRPFQLDIRNEDFLRFTVDHEAFHCLDAYFEGAPFRKTSNGVTSHYDHFLSEARADAYASLMFRRTHAPKKDFLNRMAILRTQALADEDTLHLTSQVIGLSTSYCLAVDMLEPEEVVNVATKLVNRNSPSLGKYGEHLANVVETVKQLGGDARGLSRDFDLKSLPGADETKVAAMVSQVETGRHLIRSKQLAESVLNSDRNFAKK